MEVVEDIEWLEPAADRDSDYVPSGDEDSDEDVSERDHSDGEAEDMEERVGLGEAQDGAEEGGAAGGGGAAAASGCRACWYTHEQARALPHSRRMG